MLFCLLAHNHMQHRKVGVVADNRLRPPVEAPAAAVGQADREGMVQLCRWPMHQPRLPGWRLPQRQPDDIDPLGIRVDDNMEALVDVAHIVELLLRQRPRPPQLMRPILRMLLLQHFYPDDFWPSDHKASSPVVGDKLAAMRLIRCL